MRLFIKIGAIQIVMDAEGDITVKDLLKQIEKIWIEKLGESNFYGPVIVSGSISPSTLGVLRNQYGVPFDHKKTLRECKIYHESTLVAEKKRTDNPSIEAERAYCKVLVKRAFEQVNPLDEAKQGLHDEAINKAVTSFVYDRNQRKPNQYIDKYEYEHIEEFLSYLHRYEQKVIKKLADYYSKQGDLNHFLQLFNSIQPNSGAYKLVSEQLFYYYLGNTPEEKRDLEYQKTIFKYAYLAETPEAHQLYSTLAGEKGLNPILQLTFGSDVELIIQTAVLIRDRNQLIERLRPSLNSNAVTESSSNETTTAVMEFSSSETTNETGPSSNETTINLRTNFRFFGDLITWPNSSSRNEFNYK